jgi:hypothetical protein
MQTAQLTIHSYGAAPALTNPSEEPLNDQTVYLADENRRLRLLLADLLCKNELLRRQVDELSFGVRTTQS